ncbi:MAG: recombinase family protein [Deltaproteobacteria bacterium]|nr:recombinase family protein [Deltaproteobacteria bacterium]
MVDRKLVVNEGEAPLVRRVFDLYLEKRSAVGVANILNAEHQTTKYHSSSNGNSRGSKVWNKNSVLSLLRNGRDGVSFR